MAESGEQWFRNLIDGLPAAVYATDAEGRLQFYNRAFAELTGSEPAAGQNVQLKMYLPDGTPLPESSCPMTVARKEQRALPGLETLIERPDGTRTPFIIYPAPLPGSPRSFINLLVDISTRKESEAHTRALLSQLIHREKNEIQTIQSLLAGALREAQSSEARDVLADTARRVGALAAAQNAIDRHGGGIFAAESLLEALCRNAAQSFGRILDIHVERASGALPNRAALPLAIIVNELVTNSVKHARGDRSRVAVGLAFMQEHHNSLLTVQDDGPGFTPGPPKRRASGLGLVEGLARQLGGAVEITTRNGALCTLRFPN